MRVLHLIETLGRGGAERLLVTTLPALMREGIEPIVGVLDDPYHLEPDLEMRGIRVLHLRRLSKWNLLAARRVLLDICRREDIAVVHAHLYFPSLYAALCRLAGGPPMVETFHNLAYAGANARNWKLAIRRRLRSGLLKCAVARKYGVSAAVAKHYEQALGLAAGEVSVLPNSIDLEAIDAVKASLRKDERLQIVVPGRLVKEKGHVDLLEALAECDVSQLDLRFVGGGPLETQLAEAARTSGISITITGGVSHEDFLAEMAAADIVVTPSHYEGFGIAAAEAMALGKPVIASNAGGLPEVIGEAGILFPTGDIKALKDALERLVKDQGLRASLGEAAQSRARSEFAPARAAAQLAADYRSLLSESGKHAGSRKR